MSHSRWDLLYRCFQVLMTTEINYFRFILSHWVVLQINIACAACERLIVVYYLPLIRYYMTPR
jgi:hypothetical protein